MDPNTWTDHGSTGIESSSSKAYNAIDGNLFNDGGSLYMTFGSFWANLYQAPMNSPPTSVSGSSYQVAYDPENGSPVEAAYLYKNGGFYYLFFSWGTCCGYDAEMPAEGMEYQIKACRSESATGGFVRLSLFFFLLVNVLTYRLMRMASPALKEGARWFWQAMGMSTDRVASMSLSPQDFLLSMLIA